jgi:N-acetylglucosamine kinase-like BadF-type ATPase
MGLTEPYPPDTPGSDAHTSLAILAIDAGNSKTDTALLGADGSLLGTARGGGFRPPAVGVPAAVEVLAETIGAAHEAAGAGRGVVPVRHVVACLANADLPVEEEQLAAALSERGWGERVTVRNDTFAVLRAGLTVRDGWDQRDEGAEQDGRAEQDEAAAGGGVAVVCGAGINCVGVAPDGRTARFPALGRLSGDWGGGGGLAEEALWYAARAEDGRGEPTLLCTALPAHFGLGSMYALIEAVHLGRIPFARRLELAPVLFEVAALGDAVADALVARMAEEVVTMAVVALRRLDLLEDEVPVMLGGSLLAAGHPLLDDRITGLLARRAPRAVPRVVRARPVLGAALLGLDALGADAAAYERARRCLRRPGTTGATEGHSRRSRGRMGGGLRGQPSGPRSGR